MTREECIRQAEFYLKQAEDTRGKAITMYCLAVAQVYATLAVAKK